MRISKPAAWAASALVLLGPVLTAGCSKGGGNAAAGGAGAGTPQASAPDMAINPADVPRLKAGYWESTSTTNGRPAGVSRFCSSGKPVAPPAQMARGCSTFSYKRSMLGAVVIDADCAEGPISSKLHAVSAGDFNSAYVTDSKVEIAMQGRPASSFTTHTETRWVGPCPAGAAADE